MLKADKEVVITATSLVYDGEASRATYTGKANLIQGEVTINAESLVIDDKSGNLTATGGVTTTGKLVEEKADQTRESVLSIGKGKEFMYVEADRRATYDGNASLVGNQRDMSADRIELYLKESGDQVEHAEAHQHVRLTEKGYTITGNEMKYFSKDEHYELSGTPLTIVDKCGVTATGLSLTYFRATDRIIVDGTDQTRTQTTGKGSTCP